MRQRMCILWAWRIYISFIFPMLYCLTGLESFKMCFWFELYPVNLDECFSSWIKTFPKHGRKLDLVGISAMFWTLWECRNDMCFNRRLICDPMTLMKMMCAWIFDWSVLQMKEPDIKLLTLGGRLVERVASEIYTPLQGWRPGVLQLGASFILKKPAWGLFSCMYVFRLFLLVADDSSRCWY